MATTKKQALNKAAPGVGKTAQLGDVLEELITKHNSLLAKLDADAGVTDTTYTSLLAITPLASR